MDVACVGVDVRTCVCMHVYTLYNLVYVCATQNDNPGPGAYNSGCDPLEAPSVSSSQRGTGGFASKVECAQWLTCMVGNSYASTIASRLW